MDGLSGAIKVVGNFVGVDDTGAEIRKHFCHYRFSAGQSAGESYPQHLQNPRLRRHAFTVFTISMAMVNGPTPPGTGVIAPATSATCGSTSPISVEPFSANDFSRAASPAKNLSNSARDVILLVPTSITTAPGFTNSLVIIPALPMAATTMS